MRGRECEYGEGGRGSCLVRGELASVGAPGCYLVADVKVLGSKSYRELRTYHGDITILQEDRVVCLDQGSAKKRCR